jgi:hypothetical protein
MVDGQWRCFFHVQVGFRMLEGEYGLECGNVECGNVM